MNAHGIVIFVYLLLYLDIWMSSNAVVKMAQGTQELVRMPPKMDMDVVKWCHQNGCPWDTKTCENAAINGHLDVIKRCRQNGCDWPRVR
jgi:hypothetical protein